MSAKEVAIQETGMIRTAANHALAGSTGPRATTDSRARHCCRRAGLLKAHRRHLRDGLHDLAEHWCHGLRRSNNGITLSDQLAHAV